MIVAPPLSLEQYFANPTKPASEFVDGELFQKAMPTNLHADLQFWIAQLLYELFGRPRHRIRTEQNLRLSAQVLFIPDVCVLSNDSREPGSCISIPPLLCVEILSPSDRFLFTVEKCQDYLRWGVPACWILDPESQQAWVVNLDNFTRVTGNGLLTVDGRSLPMADVFPEAQA